MSVNIPHRPPMVPSKVAAGGGGPNKKPMTLSGQKRRAPNVNIDGGGGGGGGGTDPADDLNQPTPDGDPNNQDPMMMGGDDGGASMDGGGGGGGDADGASMDGGDDLQPIDQPIQRQQPQQQQQQQQRAPAGRGLAQHQQQQRRGGGGGGGGVNRAPMGYANHGGRAPARGGGGPAPMDAGSNGEDEENVVLPDDPTEAKKVMDRLMSKKKTEDLRKKCQPSAPTVLNISQRRAPAAIKLANLNPDLCDLEKKCKKSTDPRQAMYFVTHLYAGKAGPIVQVEGRLTTTPMVSATFDTTNYTVELHDPIEQRNWSGMSRQFKKNFTKRATEEKWPYAGQMINKMVFRDFYLRGKIIDPSLRDKYADPDLLPPDMVDPDTKQVIECYPPRIKAQLVMSKKNRNELETDVMDENDIQMNPFDFRRGNLVRLAIRMGYGYWKAVLGAQVPNEYGMPCKLAMIKRLDTQEETDGGPLKRTKWADEDVHANTLAAETSAAQITAPPTTTTTAAATQLTPPPTPTSVPAPPGGPSAAATTTTTNVTAANATAAATTTGVTAAKGAEALVLAVAGDAGAALRAVVAQQLQASTTKPPTATLNPPKAPTADAAIKPATDIKAPEATKTESAPKTDKPKA
jgi:hypothetical protein